MAEVKYHINDDGDALRCRAKIRCKFGGASGFEYHFDSLQEAQERAQEVLRLRHGLLGGTTRGGRKESGVQGAAAKDLVKMERSGMNVAHIDSVLEHDFSADEAHVSCIDVLEEKPDEALLASMRAFHGR